MVRLKLRCNYALDTVDGRNPAPVLRLVVYPVICRVLCVPGGAGFLQSTVWWLKSHI